MLASSPSLSTSSCSELSLLGRVLGGAALLCISMPLLAQFHPADYYLARANKSGPLQIAEQLHLQKAERHLAAREYESAYGESKFTLGQFPNHPQALLVVIDVCSKWKSPRCTVDDLLQKAKEINPKAADTYVIGGIYLHRVHRYQDAIQSFNEAIKLDPSSVNAHYNLGLSYFETKQYARANDEAQQAYALGAPLSGLRMKLQGVKQWKPQERSAARDGGGSTNRPLQPEPKK
jgi:tetratricopeptide (TPR) repeat protein